MFNSKPNIIDIVASSFTSYSFPIEIGIILQSGERYCALIKPHESWQDWDEKAEKIHNISKELLRKHGKPIDVVADEINEILANKTVYSDGWVMDDSWIKKLFYTAQKSPLFTLSALETILTESQMDIWHKTKNKLLIGHEKERHRASFDATLIQKTFFETVNKTL